MSIVIKISLRLPKIQYGDNIVEVVKEYTNIGLKSYCYGNLIKTFKIYVQKQLEACLRC